VFAGLFSIAIVSRVHLMASIIMDFPGTNFQLEDLHKKILILNERLYYVMLDCERVKLQGVKGRNDGMPQASRAFEVN